MQNAIKFLEINFIQEKLNFTIWGNPIEFILFLVNFFLAQVKTKF